MVDEKKKEKTSEDYRTVVLSDGRKVVIDLSKITRRQSLQLVMDRTRAVNVGARIDALAENIDISPDDFDKQMNALEAQFLEWQRRIMEAQAPIYGLTADEMLALPQSDYDLLLKRKEELQADPVGQDPS